MPSVPQPWGFRDYPTLPVFLWLVACPLCFGGVDLWARALGWLAIGSSLILLAWLNPDWYRTFRGFGWIAGLFMLWTLLATVPLPAGWVEALVPERIKGQEHTVLAGSSTATLAYMPGQTMSAFLTLATNLLAAAIFANAARHHEGRRRLIWLIMVSGAGVILVAWFNNFTPGHIFNRRIETPGFMGPFTGRNTFANYLVLCSLVGTGFLFQRWWPLRGITHKSYWTWIAFVIVVCCVGWVMASASRGACLAWVTGLILFGILLWRMDEQGERSIGIFIGLFLVAGLTVIYAQTLIQRMDSTLAHAAVGRALTWKESVKMGFDHAWTGVGLGNFQWVFPRYQPPHRAELYTHPENEYLEWWNETGWIGAFLILLLIFRMGRKLAVAHKWKDIEWQIGGLAALGALAVHAFVDFPLHIPANAFLTAAIVGLVWGNLMRHPDEIPGFGREFIARLFMIVAGSALVLFAVLAIRAEWLANRGEYAAASRFWPIDPKFREPQVRELIDRSEYLPAHRLAVESQGVAPVDWKLYYLDGWSLAPLYRKADDARAAFEKAIYWSPSKSETARKAGLFFWPRRPEISVMFWNLSLEYETEQHRAFYLFLQRTQGIPGQSEFARVLAGRNIDHLIVLADWIAESGPRELLDEIVQAIVSAPPADPQRREQLVSLLLKLGHYQQAEALLAKTQHKTLKMKYYEAEAYRHQKQWRKAIDHFHALLSALPEAGKVPRLSQLSLETLLRKSDTEPDSLDIQSAAAWKLMKAERWQEAESRWFGISQRWPEYKDALRFRARCLDEQGKLEAAAEAWKAYFSAVLHGR